MHTQAFTLNMREDEMRDGSAAPRRNPLPRTVTDGGSVDAELTAGSVVSALVFSLFLDAAAPSGLCHRPLRLHFGKKKRNRAERLR